MPTYPQDPSAFFDPNLGEQWPPQVRAEVDPENHRRLNVTVRMPPTGSYWTSYEGEIRREEDDDFRERALEYMRPRHQTLYSATGDIELDRDGLRQLREMITERMIGAWEHTAEHPPLEPPRTTCWQYILSEDAA